MELQLDEGSFSKFAMFLAHRSTDFRMAADLPAGDGVVTGWGMVNGRLDICVIAGFHRFRPLASAPVIGINESAGRGFRKATPNWPVMQRL